MRLIRSQEGSVPLALLASIVVAGLITTLVATVIQSERTVRFDRSFTTVITAADAGIQEAYHMLSAGLIDMDIADEPLTFSGDNNGMAYEWEIDRLSARTFEVVSTGETTDETSRTVVVRIDKDALFFPGAFGDQLVGLQGNSTHVDSYESGTSSCSGNTNSERCWGYPTDDPPGTGKAALGTNGNFAFKGNSESIVRAILYDWVDNPPDDGSVTATNPGGSRCDDSGALNKQPCTHDVLRMNDDALEYGTDTEMAFIHDRLDSCEGRWLHEGEDHVGVSRGDDVTYIGTGGPNDPPAVLVPYSDDPDDSQGSAADAGWDNYWCADSIQVRGHVEVDGTAETPVVIFIQDSYSQAGHRRVNWPGASNTNFGQMSGWRSERPVASSLQLFIASDTPEGATANVSIAQQAVFAGVVYAPRSICSGAQSNAAANIYGALICRTISNVGNWKFHYDEMLADITRDTYSVTTWREEQPDPA
jgi:hypothetical protein